MERPVWDRALLDELSQVMRDASICGLGQAAPNPLLCVMRYFPEEFAPGGRRMSVTVLQRTPRPSPSSSTATCRGPLRARRSGRSRSGSAPTSRISAIRPSPATGRTAIAAPAWSRSRASACSPPPACASPAVGMQVNDRHGARREGARHGDGAPRRRSAGARDLARSDSAVLGAGRRDRRRRRAASRLPSAGRPMRAIRRCASISTPASSAISACAPAARCRSTT